ATFTYRILVMSCRDERNIAQPSSRNPIPNVPSASESSFYRDAVGGLQRGRDRSACSSEYAGHFGLRKGKEALHHYGVKLRAAGQNQPAHRLFKRQALPIRPRRNHGIECVDHADDSRNDWNFRFL